jgi:NMD protein affecting ribosome stability and mRNA decay
VNGFICKRCKEPKPSEQEVKTRFPTKICRTCWSSFVAHGHRKGTTIALDKCIGCGVNPRPVLDEKRRGLCDICIAAARKNTEHRGNN